MSKPDECECCRFETKALKEYGPLIGSSNRKPQRWLCELCAGTMTSMADSFRSQYERGTLETLKTLCYIGNAILKAVKR